MYVFTKFSFKYLNIIVEKLPMTFMDFIIIIYYHLPCNGMWVIIKYFLTKCLLSMIYIEILNLHSSFKLDRIHVFSIWVKHCLKKWINSDIIWNISMIPHYGRNVDKIWINTKHNEHSCCQILCKKRVINYFWETNSLKEEWLK